MNSRICVAWLLASVAITGFAQTDTRLPASLSGRWTYVGPSGVIVDAFSIAFEGNGTQATVPGKLTWRGMNCGAKDEPIQATWDGTELKFEAVLKANANTQRMQGNCPTEATTPRGHQASRCAVSVIAAFRTCETGQLALAPSASS